MSRIATLLILLFHLRFARSNFRTCVPNTQFILNDRMCYCDGKGQWTDASCLLASQRQVCQPGRIVWHGCSQCVCQENGQLLCNMVSCPDEPKSVPKKGIDSIGPWCIPYRIYYVDCNICVCPQTALTANVHCVKDPFCTALRTPSLSDLLTTNKNSCKPKVLYLFSCLQCLCSDEGVFIASNCVETCPTKSIPELTRTCTPQTFYRNDCNVCMCPRNGIHNDASCTHEVCDGKYRFKALQSLESETKTCTSHKFTSPRCLYCHCNPEGSINQQACLELSCFNTQTSHLNVMRTSCNPGEMVPFCTECFCPSNGTTNHEYCTKGCSYQNKVDVLGKVFKDSDSKQLLNWASLDVTSDALTCTPNSIYTENGKHCLCPDSETKEKSCIVAAKKGFDFQNPASQLVFKEIKLNFDFNSSCEPSTFVEFDCNSCFCSKNGTIDPKWCTYDDCEAIQLVKAAQQKPTYASTGEHNHRCTPGAISEDDCNFCICPENGRLKDKACTKNPCTGAEPATAENFDCDPLQYYEVDCNVCLCPRDGKKNVAKCTKNVCEDNFLRNDACVPVRLFSDACNICVCPQDGNKADRVCTKHTCRNSSWKKIFKLSNSILGDIPEYRAISASNLDLCFPGEEYIEGDKFCVCPEMGMRSYATCSDMVLEEDKVNEYRKDEGEADVNLTLGVGDSFTGRRQLALTNECFVYNMSVMSANCTPGSTYIQGCQQCICPSTGQDEYCRPLNRTQCTMSGLGTLNINNLNTSTTIEKIALAPHEHTRYKHTASRTARDRCHVCECEQDDTIVREHCFSAATAACAGVEPTFLGDKILN